MANPFVYWRDWWRSLSLAERFVVVSIAAVAVCVVYINPVLAADDTSNNQVVWIALIGAVSPLVGAALLVVLNGRAARRLKEDEAKTRSDERKEEWARQDAVAEKLLAQQIANAARTDAAALEIARVSVKIDGLLVDRDKAKIAEGKEIGKQAGEVAAQQLAEGQRQGRESANVSAKDDKPAVNDAPLPVADDRVAVASERGADALVKSAEAQQRVAQVAENPKL